MAAVTMEGELYSRVRTRSLNSFDSVAFIQRLQAQRPESKRLVVWDGSPIHRFKAVRTFQLARAIKALRAKPHLIQACFGAAKLGLQLYHLPEIIQHKTYLRSPWWKCWINSEQWYYKFFMQRSVST